MGGRARRARRPSVRELYVVSSAETDDPSRFVTDIQWPVHKETTP